MFAFGSFFGQISTKGCSAIIALEHYGKVPVEDVIVAHCILIEEEEWGIRLRYGYT